MCWSAKDYQRVDFRDNDVIADTTVEPLRPASNQSVQIRFLGYIPYSNTVIIPKLWSSGNCVIRVPFTLRAHPPPLPSALGLNISMISAHGWARVEKRPRAL